MAPGMQLEIEPVARQTPVAYWYFLVVDAFSASVKCAVCVLNN